MNIKSCELESQHDSLFIHNGLMVPTFAHEF